MKSLSEFKSRKEWREFIWLEFLREVKKTKSEEQFKEILESVLSAKEKNLIINRLMAAALIKNGKTYREISELLWLSPNTISAIKKNLLRKSFYQGYRGRPIVIDKKLKKKITIEDLGDASIDLLNAINAVLNKFLPPITGKGRWGHLSPPTPRRNKK